MKLNFRIDFGYQYLYSRRHYHPQYVWDGTLTCEGGTVTDTFRLDYPVIWFGPGYCARETKLPTPSWSLRTKRGMTGVRFEAEVEENAVFHLSTAMISFDFSAKDILEKGHIEVPVGPKYLGCFAIVTRTGYYWFRQPLKAGETAIEPDEMGLPVHDWARMHLAWLAPGACVSWQVQVDSVGESGGYPIYRVRFTDRRVPAENKQHILILTQHSGMEISGMNAVLAFGDFLASDDPRTAQMLEKTEIQLMPCCNPFSFAKQNTAYQFKNAFGVDEYTSFTYEGANKGGKNPSAEAVQRVIDAFQPDILIDCHGVWYEHQLVAHSFGDSAFTANRFYNEEIIKMIQQAGIDAGFAEYDTDFRETLPWTDTECTDEAIRAKFHVGGAGGRVAPIYAYVHYHTMGGSFEISSGDEAVAKLIRAVEIGMERFPTEYYAGYPTRTFKEPYGHNSLRAYGQTAAARRESRIELWNKRKSVMVGIAHPEMPGYAGVIVGTDSALAKQIVGKYYTPVSEMIDRMAILPNADLDEMRREIADFYEPFAAAEPAECGDVQIEHGLTVRIAIPFAKAVPQVVAVNGRLLSEDEADGYTLVRGRNWTFVDINLPPQAVPPFLYASCRYTTAENA